MRDPWYQRLSGRERLLLGVTVAAALLASWYRLFWLPYAQQWGVLERHLAEQTQNQAQLLAETRNRVPWQEQSTQWVPPGEVAMLIDRLTQTDHRLRLVGLEVRPPRLLFSCAQGWADAGSASLFRHELLLTLEGGYPAILTYLHRLQEMPWTIQVDHLGYTVAHPPTASLLLQLHFLSLSRSLFVD